MSTKFYVHVSAVKIRQIRELKKSDLKLYLQFTDSILLERKIGKILPLFTKYFIFFRLQNLMLRAVIEILRYNRGIIPNGL